MLIKRLIEILIISSLNIFEFTFFLFYLNFYFANIPFICPVTNILVTCAAITKCSSFIASWKQKNCTCVRFPHTSYKHAHHVRTLRRPSFGFRYTKPRVLVKQSRSIAEATRSIAQRVFSSPSNQFPSWERLPLSNWIVSASLEVVLPINRIFATIPSWHIYEIEFSIIKNFINELN